ncbi:MAG: nucleoside hydrolase [Planctomycetota bacterium]|jgi:hypothetical protein
MSKNSLSTSAQSVGTGSPAKSRWNAGLGILAIFLVTLIFTVSSIALAAAPAKKIPVIFDTDICDDIDDTWALVMLLQSSEFDIKLITTAVNNTPEKAKVVARILEIAGRTDIPIGIEPQTTRVGKGL